MTRQLQMTVILSTLVLLLAVGWPISLWSLGECLHFRGPLPISLWSLGECLHFRGPLPISLWSLGECLYFRGPLPNRWGWLTEPWGFGRTPVKNHWFNTCDRSTTAAAYDLCCNDLLNNFSGPHDAYWCVVNSVLLTVGPNTLKFD